MRSPGIREQACFLPLCREQCDGTLVERHKGFSAQPSALVCNHAAGKIAQASKQVDFLATTSHRSSTATR
jgi:hypothetical protein